MNPRHSLYVKERHGAQLGPLDAILRTSKRFLIRSQSGEASRIAVQISRNLFQYFSADSEIVDTKDGVTSDQGNEIIVAMGDDFPESAAESKFPIHFLANRGIRIRNWHGFERVFELQEGLGAILLRPLYQDRLELIIWGLDELGLRLAARLQPMLTGVGQPEFIIVRNCCAWKGANGVLAMGSFDNSWTVSDTSYIT